MRTVEIRPGIHTSILGFGCAPILGSVDGQTAQQALAAALDVGITHFDLARSYGYGEAELFVGRFLRNRRSEVTIATKFGIEATPLAALLGPTKPILRRLRGRRKPPATSDSAAPAQPGRLPELFLRRRPITSRLLLRSLETSLRKLGTDYVDFLFIHEPLESVGDIDDVFAAADNAKAQGKLRAFGLAFMTSQAALHSDYLDRFAVLQFDNSPGAPHYPATLAERSEGPNIFFSPFRHRAAGETPAGILRRLSTDFPRSITLCSMYKPSHIRQNAEVCS